MGRDYTRYVERARDDRAEEAGIGRLYTGLFIAVVGPLALAAMGFLEIAPSRYIMYGVVATAPIGALPAGSTEGAETTTTPRARLSLLILLRFGGSMSQ